MKDKKRQDQKGFTLFELLVVISIIGLLVAIATVSYSAAQKRSRDAKRRADIQAIQKAFEQYYAANNTYNDPCSAMAGALPGGLLPVDPKTGASYSCTVSSDVSSYCVCAALEIQGTGNAGNSSCSYGGSKNYYCASNLQ